MIQLIRKITKIMMKLNSSNFILLFLLILFKQIVNSARFSYKGYKLYKVIPKNEIEAFNLFKLNKQMNLKLDFLNIIQTPNESIHIAVSPQDQLVFTTFLNKELIENKILINDLDVPIRSERKPRPRTDFASSPIEFNRYLTYSEINEYLKYLAQKYPTTVKLKCIGHTIENREIYSIKISNGSRGKKKMILIDGGVHAREWISPAAAIFIIYQLVEKFEKNKGLLDGYNWLIIPLVNPDGYEYSQEVNRLWRKNRTPNNNCEKYKHFNSINIKLKLPNQIYNHCIHKFQLINNNELLKNISLTTVICGFGTDINRNFDSHWGIVTNNYEDDPCKDAYYGKHAFSEIETRALRGVLVIFKENIKMYLSLHSFGRKILYPWGYTNDQQSINQKELHDIATIGANEIQKITGMQYKVGTISGTLYRVGGSSVDYAHEKLDIPIALAMELPQGDKSKFHPNTEEIRQFVEETWVGITAMVKEVMNRSK